MNCISKQVVALGLSLSLLIGFVPQTNAFSLPFKGYEYKPTTTGVLLLSTFMLYMAAQMYVHYRKKTPTAIPPKDNSLVEYLRYVVREILCGENGVEDRIDSFEVKNLSSALTSLVEALSKGKEYASTEELEDLLKGVDPITLKAKYTKIEPRGFIGISNSWIKKVITPSFAKAFAVSLFIIGAAEAKGAFEKGSYQRYLIDCLALFGLLIPETKAITQS